MGICCSRCPKIYCSCCQGDEYEERQSATLGSDLPVTLCLPLSPQPGSTELHDFASMDDFLESSPASPPKSDPAFPPRSGSTELHLLRDPKIKVTHQSNTSITLRSSEEDCELNDCFKKAQELLRPGVRELILTGTNFLHSDPIEPKNETLELLRIQAERGNLHRMLHSVAQNCSALTELELTLGETYRTDPPPLASVVCHSLRVLDLSVGQLTLLDLIALLDVIAVVYPNVQRLSITVTGHFQSEGKSLVKDAGLPLHHLDVLKFSSQGMDPEGEHHLKQTVYAFCPQLAKTKSQDGASFFRRIHGASGFVDHLGGELSLPTHNVKLSIPPGALEGREKISIEVFSELPNCINLQGNEVVASYGFRCFPSGLTFNKPLTLSMSHCAVIDDRESMGMVLYSGSDNSDQITRIPLEISDYVIRSDVIELQLRHFSWGILAIIYNWLFPKKMLCTPFRPTTLPKDQENPILHLRIYSQLPNLSKEIEEEEKSINYVKAYGEQELVMKDDAINIALICESSELPSEHREEITTKGVMHRTKLIESITLPTRKSTVTIIIKQEDGITMKFWADFTDSSSSEAVGETVARTDAPVLTVAGPRREEFHQGVSPVSPRSVVPYVPSRHSEEYSHPHMYSSVQNPSLPFHRRRPRPPGCLTDEQLEALSRRLPLDKFTAICVGLEFSNTETENVRTKSSDAQTAYFTMLTRWQEETGAPKAKFVDVLKNVKLFGLVQSCLETDNDPEDIDSS